jgi:hypothetical protein
MSRVDRAYERGGEDLMVCKKRNGLRQKPLENNLVHYVIVQDGSMDGVLIGCHEATESFRRQETTLCT